MSHLVIAGTGRAGTSHLVRWLAARGLDIGEFAPDAWHQRARAGLERRLTGDGLPYVVKDPWLYTYCHEVDPACVDVLVIPVRRLADAAWSRVRLERQEIADRAPGWRADHWGATPGGMIHEVSVHAQMPVLAVGFHELVQWAVEHDVETVLLDFARIGDDDYLASKLGRWLP